jgi:DNA ligase-1
MDERLPRLASLEEPAQKAQLAAWWDELPQSEIFLLQKLIAGGFRVGVSEGLVLKGLAMAAGLPAAIVQQRVTGQWTPTAAAFQGFVAPADEDARDATQPWPFALAYPLDDPLSELGPRDDWLAEWKWDGIRAQLVCRDGACHVWSRGEDLVTSSFPELAAAAAEGVPRGTVLDGEILAFRDGAPLPFAALQKRLGRKRVSAQAMAATPLRFLAYDLLEAAGEDVRALPMAERRARLEALVGGVAAAAAARGETARIGLSPLVGAGSWEELARLRQEARARGVEGLMLKRRDAPYRAGRKRGDWWKWKIEPFTCDAVLLYAQAGSGRRANLFTDYTFAVWRGDALVPVAKAYSGLDHEEILELDRWIRAHTREKFGPVRSVAPELVFELAFEGIQASTRHKAGVALRFPRIQRWRRDKPAAQADTLDTLRALLGATP